MLQTYEQNSRKKLAATIVALLVIAGSVVLVNHLERVSSTSNLSPVASTSTTSGTAAASNSSTDTSTNTSISSGSTSSDTSSSTDSGASNSTSGGSVKDGTYTAASDYYVPHGDETIQVSLTLQNGVISDASIQNSEGDRESASYQEEFASSYKSYVIGKKITDLKLGVIAGASDTTQGFNDALSQIATKAQSS